MTNTRTHEVAVNVAFQRCMLRPSLWRSNLNRSTSLEKPYDDDHENDEQQQVDQIAADRDNEGTQQPEQNENNDDGFKCVTWHVGLSGGTGTWPRWCGVVRSIVH